MIHVVQRIKGTETINGRGLALIKEGMKWLLGRPSLLAISPSLVYAFANTHDLRSAPNIQLDFALGNYSCPGSGRLPVIKLGFYQLRPRSTGFVHARSADSFQTPVIQPNYLDDEFDRQVAVAGIKALRRMLNTSELSPITMARSFPAHLPPMTLGASPLLGKPG